MRFAVIGSPSSWYLHDLRRAADAQHEIVSLPFRDLTARVPANFETSAESTAAAVLATADAVLLRSMPPGSLEQVVFRMDMLARLEAGGQVVVNPPKAIEAAVDKFLTTARLAEAGLRVPRTWVCQTVEEGLRAFEALGGDVVIKPLFGAEGRGIARLNDPALAERSFNLLVQLGAVLYLQEFVPHHGFDLRVLLVGQQVWCMRRTNLLDWRTNVSRGATCQRAEPEDAVIEMARRAAAAVGAPLAGVDLLPGRDGEWYAIEVNAVPGWQSLSRTLDVDIAAAVLEYLAERRRQMA